MKWRASFPRPPRSKLKSGSGWRRENPTCFCNGPQQSDADGKCRWDRPMSHTSHCHHKHTRAYTHAHPPVPKTELAQETKRDRARARYVCLEIQFTRGLVSHLEAAEKGSSRKTKGPRSAVSRFAADEFRWLTDAIQQRFDPPGVFSSKIRTTFQEVKGHNSRTGHPPSRSSTS